MADDFFPIFPKFETEISKYSTGKIGLGTPNILHYILGMWIGIPAMLLLMICSTFDNYHNYFKQVHGLHSNV